MGRTSKAVVEYRIYELQEKFPIILLDGEQWHISDVKNKRLHFHNCFEIGLCHTDSGTMVFEEDSKKFNSGDVTCIPKNIAHTTYSDKGTKSLWSYIFLDINHFLGESILPEEAVNHEFIDNIDFYYFFNKRTYPRIYFYVTSLINELREKNTGYKKVVRNLICALYYEFLRMRESNHPSSAKGIASVHSLAPALDYINKHSSTRIYIDDLAKMCNLSTTHFRRVFHSVMGYSPHYYINKLRIINACELLINTSNSILSISESVGFFSVSSFNRSFLNMISVSPSTYRKTKGVDKDTKESYVLPYTGWMRAEDLGNP